MFATDDRGQRLSQADFSPDPYNGVQQMYTPPSEWTPARRALPPWWPTTWPPSPSPWTTGSPGRCSNSSSRGPKGSSAGLQASYVVYICTVPYLCSSTITVKYIRLRSDLIPRTPKVYRGADDQSYQTWLLLHSTMQCPTVTVQIIVC